MSKSYSSTIVNPEALIDPNPEQSTVANRHLKVKFAPTNSFHKKLKQRVNQHFIANDRSPKDSTNLYQKTFVIMTWFIVSWTLLVFAAQTWWQAGLLCISLALAMGGIGFSIQHDGNHKAYSNHSWINQVAGFGADLMGVSSYFWNLHHTLVIPMSVGLIWILI
jgi:linoleoyl-CoA desaturase